MTTTALLEDTQKLIELLNSVMETSIDKVKQAEQIITELTNEHFDRFCLTLLDNIIIPEATANETVKQIALLLIKPSLKKKEKTDLLMSETGNLIRQKCLGLMFSPSIGKRLQNIISGILETLYSQPLDPQNIQTDLVNIKHYVATNKNNTPLLLTMQALGFLNAKTKAQIPEQYDEIVAWLVEIGNQEICALKAGIHNEKIEILIKWLDAIRQFVTNEFAKAEVTQEHLSLLQEKVYYQRLPGILLTLLELNFHPISNALIPTDNHHYGAENVQRIRSQTFEVLTLLIDILEPFISKIDITKFPIYQALENDTLQFILNGLISFLRSPEYVETFENDNYMSEENEEILRNAIFFLRQALKFKQNFDLGLPINDILMYLCLPMMKTTEQERRNNQDMLNEFINSLEDLCCGPELPEKKNSIAAFLIALISNNNQVQLSIIDLLIKIVDYSVSEEGDILDYPELAKYQDSTFISKIQAEDRIEACLLLITSLNTIADAQMKQIVKEMIQRQCPLLANLSFSVRTNLCLLIACYFESLLPNQDLATECFRFVLESVNIKDEEAVCFAEAANLALDLLFENKSLGNFLGNYVVDTVRVLIEIIQEEKRSSLIKTLARIVEKYEPQILQEPELLKETLKILIEKIKELFKQELAEYAWKDELELTVNLFINICQKTQYMVKFQDQLVSLAQTICTLLEQIKFLEADDKLKHKCLINILVPFLPFVKELIPHLLSRIYSKLPDVMKFKKGPDYLINPINEIIIQSGNGNNEVFNGLVQIISMIINNKNASNHKKIKCQGALLLQSLFQYVKPPADAPIEQIFKKTFAQLEETDPSVQVQLLCVFLCALQADLENSQNILAKSKMLKDIVDLLLKNALKFGEIPYCKKVYIIGLSSILSQPNLSEELKSRLPELFNSIMSLLQSKSEEETEDKSSDQTEEEENQSEGEIEIEEGDEEWEEDDGSFEEDDELDQEEVEILTKNFKTKFKEENEVEFFKREVGLLKQKNPQLLNELIEGLSEVQKEWIQNLEV